MREEMLGHLQGIYDGERKHHGEHKQAVQSAIKRFGSSEQLSAELHSSVPWIDIFKQYMEPFPPKSTWPHSVFSLSIWSCVANFILISPIIIYISIATSGLEAILIMLIATVGITGLLLYLYGIAGACHGVLCHRKSKLRAVVYSVVFCSVISVLGKLTMHPGSSWLPSIGYAVILTLGLANISLALGKFFRDVEDVLNKTREWDALDISTE